MSVCCCCSEIRAEISKVTLSFAKASQMISCSSLLRDTRQKTFCDLMQMIRELVIVAAKLLRVRRK